MENSKREKKASNLSVKKGKKQRSQISKEHKIYYWKSEGGEESEVQAQIKLW